MQNILYTKQMKSILFAWLGKKDIECLTINQNKGLGAIAQAITDRKYSNLALISDFKQEIIDTYITELKRRFQIEIEFFPIHLDSPTNYEEIYKADISVIAKVREKYPEFSFTYHLSPGTPAMTAVWILIAHSLYPAKLIESSPEAGVKDVVLPFDITANFNPDKKAQFESNIVELTTAKPPENSEFKNIIHQCDAMKKVINQAYRLSKFDVPVLILGESGTGKELFARAIHASSSRNKQKMVSINCGAIPQDLIESELFGYVKGAFTGANKDKIGIIEAAHESTLFLDKVGDLSLAAQVKLLRVIQDGIVIPVGSTDERKVDVRIITKTNKDLFDEIQNGSFREDLFHRIAVGVIKLPALRERKGDINILISHFEKFVNEEFQKYDGWQYKNISSDARNFILSSPWNGNIRELQNAITRMIIWSDEKEVSLETAKTSIISVPNKDKDIMNRVIGGNFNINDLLKTVARHYLEKSLKESAGNKSKTTELLGLPNYQTFTNWCKKYGLE